MREERKAAACPRRVSSRELRSAGGGGEALRRGPRERQGNARPGKETKVFTRCKERSRELLRDFPGRNPHPCGCP